MHDNSASRMSGSCKLRRILYLFSLRKLKSDACKDAERPEFTQGPTTYSQGPACGKHLLDRIADVCINWQNSLGENVALYSKNLENKNVHWPKKKKKSQWSKSTN